MAADYGARVVRLDWPDDFAAARNVSLDQAAGDWIMWLDADNQISPQDVEVIREKLNREKKSIIWCIEVVVPQGERLMQKRVFPNRPDVRFAGKVHEQLIHPAGFRQVLTEVEIRHFWGYADPAEAREKGRRNLKLLEEMVAENPGDFYLCYQLGKTSLNLRRFEQAAEWLTRGLPESGRNIDQSGAGRPRLGAVVPSAGTVRANGGGRSGAGVFGGDTTRIRAGPFSFGAGSNIAGKISWPQPRGCPGFWNWA